MLLEAKQWFCSYLDHPVVSCKSLLKQEYILFLCNLRASEHLAFAVYLFFLSVNIGYQVLFLTQGVLNQDRPDFS